jgi:hypothetical protein
LLDAPGSTEGEVTEAKRIFIAVVQGNHFYSTSAISIDPGTNVIIVSF